MDKLNVKDKDFFVVMSVVKVVISHHSETIAQKVIAPKLRKDQTVRKTIIKSGKQSIEQSIGSSSGIKAHQYHGYGLF